MVHVAEIVPLKPAMSLSFKELSRMITSDCFLKINYDQVYKTYPCAGDFFFYKGRLHVPAGNGCLRSIKDEDAQKLLKIAMNFSLPIIWSEEFLHDELNFPKLKISSDAKIARVGTRKNHVVVYLRDFLHEKNLNIEVLPDSFDCYVETFKTMIGVSLKDMTFEFK